jgi:hypothetical protein
MMLFFFERIADGEFFGPVIIAAGTEEEAWGLLAVRESKGVTALREDHWHVAQDLTAIPDRPAIIYPSHYRRAILS